ncbi:hypothetical protein [Enterococcus sp. LJL51]|uniref:hypothetical protein n=1 Tax=Enterococcus sp. LJL51 TaxID=3416656 RepID=UPI003CE704B6
MKKKNSVGKRKKDETGNFFFGIILLGIGLFMLFNRVYVSSSWYSTNFFRFGRYGFSNGLVVIPLIAGIVLFFYNMKSVIAKLLMGLGVVLIVFSIITSVHIRLMATPLYVYILIMVLIGAGGGMTLKALMNERK